LIGNAFKHTPEGGAVTLSVETSPSELRVSVADTGEGIPAIALSHVFEQFYQVESHASKRDGIGIGLNISREIVKAHGGEIGVESDGQGKGAKFWFTLPLNPPA
jgi:histidine kinase